MIFDMAGILDYFGKIIERLKESKSLSVFFLGS